MSAGEKAFTLRYLVHGSSMRWTLADTLCQEGGEQKGLAVQVLQISSSGKLTTLDIPSR